MELFSLGAAQTVTGSKHLLRTTGGTLLIDCGLYQGIKKKNPNELDEELIHVDAIILTHGHLDHSGYIPKLVKHGFRGPIFATAPTIEIAKLIMADNAKIQANEARSHNKHEKKESRKVKPLYDLNDVSQTIGLLTPIEWDKPFTWNGLEITYHCAGHILGASSVLIKDKESSVVFSGDLGREHDQIMFTPKSFNDAHAVVMECTYGDRLHDKANDPESDLIKAIEMTKKGEGTLLIPAFSVARSQNILHYLVKVFNKHHHLKVPVYVDSPLTTEVTKLYERFADYHKLTEKDFSNIHKIAQFIEFKSQRESIEKSAGTKIIVTASGMMTGGLAPHYLQVLSDSSANTLMIVGYQAEGTLGREIVDGVRDFFIEATDVKWRGNVFISKAFSSHADQAELLHWLEQIKNVKQVFLVHGEESSLNTMKELIGERARIVVEKSSYSIS